MASPLTVDLDGSADELRPPVRPIAPRRRKLRERVSLGHLFMIAAGLLAFVLAVSVLQDRSVTTTILVADGEILPGRVITPDLVSEIEIPADSELVGAVATLNTISGGGVSAAHRIGAGDPLALTLLAPADSPQALRAMSVPIDRVDAAGGDLRPGDRVDVIATNLTSATYVAVNLEVLDSPAETRSGALGSTSLTTFFVTMAVDDQTALAIALAAQQSGITIVRSTGAPVVPPERRVLIGQPGQAAGGTASADAEGTAQADTGQDGTGQDGTGQDGPGETDDAGGATGTATAEGDGGQAGG